MLSPYSHNCGIPFIWKSGWIVVEPIDNILFFSIILLNMKLVLETSINIIFMFRSWSIGLDERSDFLQFTCTWCKLPSWIRERLFFASSGIVPKLVMHMCEVLYGLVGWLPPFYMGFLAHQATNWFVQGKRSCCANTSSCTRLHYPRWWFPTWTL